MVIEDVALTDDFVGMKMKMMKLGNYFLRKIDLYF